MKEHSSLCVVSVCRDFELPPSVDWYWDIPHECLFHGKVIVWLFLSPSNFFWWENLINGTNHMLRSAAALCFFPHCVPFAEPLHFWDCRSLLMNDAVRACLQQYVECSNYVGCWRKGKKRKFHSSTLPREHLPFVFFCCCLDHVSGPCRKWLI